MRYWISWHGRFNSDTVTAFTDEQLKTFSMCLQAALHSAGVGSASVIYNDNRDFCVAVVTEADADDEDSEGTAWAVAYSRVADVFAAIAVDYRVGVGLDWCADLLSNVSIRQLVDEEESAA